MAIVVSSCDNFNIDPNTPECIISKITDFDKQITCEDGVNVKEYTFQEKAVYVFNPGTCGADMTSEVVSADCISLGFLGGITGNTIINGEDFSNAVFQKLIWEK